jgi:hypothetical protein
MKTKLLAALLPVLLAGCFSSSHQIDTRNEVNVKPIEIKPIHITIDVNVKVDRALDDFFDDVDNAKKAKTPETDKTNKTETATK